MRVTSRIVVQNPVDADELFAAALAVVRLPVTGEGWHRRDFSDICILATESGQGATAQVSLLFPPDGGLLPDQEDDEVPGYAYLMFTTGGEESARVRRHHESLVDSLGQWLTARQLEWSWQHEDDVWVAGYLRTRPQTSI